MKGTSFDSRGTTLVPKLKAWLEHTITSVNRRTIDPYGALRE